MQHHVLLMCLHTCNLLTVEYCNLQMTSLYSERQAIEWWTWVVDARVVVQVHQ